MQKRLWIVLLITFCVLGAAALGLLVLKVSQKEKLLPSKPEKEDTIAVLCTTGIIADAVAHIGGDKVRVQALMGPGVDPHLYRAREGDIHALIGADIVFYNGLHLEGKMGDLLEKMRNLATVVAVADCLPKEQLRESEFEGMYDPHIWHDVSLWRSVVKYIGLQLAQYAPLHTQYFMEKAQQYSDELTLLDDWIQQRIVSIPSEKRILVTAHDAFGYFGDAYGIEVVGLQGMSTDADISTADIQDLVHMLVDRNVPVIFIESSVPQRTVQAVQEACAYRGSSIQIGDELFSDSLSDHTGPAATYTALMKHNVHAIVKGLSL